MACTEAATKRSHQPLDWPGALLTTVGLGGIVFALIESVPVAGVIGSCSLIAFLLVEARERGARR